MDPGRKTMPGLGLGSIFGSIFFRFYIFCYFVVGTKWVGDQIRVIRMSCRKSVLGCLRSSRGPKFGIRIHIWRIWVQKTMIWDILGQKGGGPLFESLGCHADFEPKGWGTTFGVLRMSCRFWTFKLGASPLRAPRGVFVFRFWTFKPIKAGETTTTASVHSEPYPRPTRPGKNKCVS